MSVYVIICGVLKNGLYLVGRTLAALIFFVRICLPLLAYDGVAGAQNGWVSLGYVVLALATMVAVVVHELGHLLACLALGAEVRAFRIGDKRALIRFRAGTVEVSLGWPYQGRVEYTGTLSVWRRAVITLAGSLTDLALGGLVLGGWAAAASGPGTPPLVAPLVVFAAGGLAATGLINLMPFRARSGRLTDGARLFELRSDIESARLLATQQTAVRLRKAGRSKELLELHAGLSVPGGRLSPAQAASLAVVELEVIILPQQLPDDAVQLADRRLSALTQQEDLGPAAPTAYLALALLRLRQGETQGIAEAERLCERTLAWEGLDDRIRPLVFAAVVMSRQARGLPYADVRDKAAATLKPGNQSPEAMAAVLRTALDPEAALRAFRDGDPEARLGAGELARLMLLQGRTDELLELHAGFAKTPAGPDALDQARALQGVEYHVLLAPELPLNVLDEAARRVQWAAAKYLLKELNDPVDRAALKHSVALARLRQGMFAEVEQWCAPALAEDVGPENRATVLATIVLARRALGQPHDALLAEAVALAPDADLVAEARRESVAAQV